MDGSFSVLTLPEPIPDFGYAEGPGGAVYIEDRSDVRACMDWRKSSFTGSGGTGSGGTGGGNCIEVAPLADGTIALRNSNHPEARTLFFIRTEMHAWIKGCEVGDLRRGAVLSLF